MPTSELSNALNPFASQARRSSTVNEYSSQDPVYSFHPVTQAPPQPYVQQANHVSELENAMVQSAPSPTAVQPRQGPYQMIAELVRIVAATQNAQEAEVARRLAWEEEQEVKAAQKQADMEKKMLDLHTELAALRSQLDIVNRPPPVASVHLPTPQFTPSMPHINTNVGIVSPSSPASHPSLFQRPMFIQGSSNSGSSHSTNIHNDSAHSLYSAPQPDVTQSLPQTSQTFTRPITQSITPDPSPHLLFVEATRSSPSTSSRPSKRLRRRSHSLSSDDGGSSSSSSNSIQSRPRKRHGHHDTRCYTIHHAMRLHLLRMMGIEGDKELPDSHTEGTNIWSSEPIRFVWDKTTKQSVHNGRMKARVLEDIKEHQRLYKHVDRKDFSKKTLDNAFEQCFTTLRQKYKAQRDDKIAEHQKKREDGKARKTRHLSRRKLKLNSRSEARNKMPAFEHVTFDGALQLDCMSSEESDTEMDPHSSQPCTILKTHGYGWRSSRLLRFYRILDDEERAESSSRPKRGSGKKERRIGPNKEQFILPPHGVATWMISTRWYKASLNLYQDLPQTLSKLVDDTSGFDWGQFHDLGSESADEQEYNDQQHPQQHTMQHVQWQSAQQLQPPYSSRTHDGNLVDSQNYFNMHPYGTNYTM